MMEADDHISSSTNNSGYNGQIVKSYFSPNKKQETPNS